MTVSRITDEILLNQFMDKLFSNNNISCDFPKDIAKLKVSDLCAIPCRNRIDLRNTPCLTIDCDDTKDMDDAVSLIKVPSGYELGVHIADVAAYIPVGSRLDEVAAERGSSIYLANRTVPMLPAILSNDLCSLNPNVDRNTISVILRLSEDGSILGSKITKSLIRSRIKGSYSEVNRILAGDASSKILRKYEGFVDTLHEMQRLSSVLLEKRRAAGANVNSTEEIKVSIHEGAVQLRLLKHGAAESLIEEFMVLANNAVAEYFTENRLPCIYRTQTRKNQQAEYKPVRDHHAELALADYVHFTSPIRRIADLRVHQVLNDWLDGMTIDEVSEKYNSDYMEESALLSTKRFRRAHEMQKLNSQFCYARYFSRRYDNLYVGKVVALNAQQLPIIRMEAYPIQMLGSAAIRARVGDRISFHINADTETRRLHAESVKRIAA